MGRNGKGGRSGSERWEEEVKGGKEGSAVGERAHEHNCVVVAMPRGELLYDTMESTWIPRRGWADVVPCPRSLRTYSVMHCY